MQGYRTLAVAVAIAVTGALQGLDFVSLLPDNKEAAGWIVSGLGVVMFILRTITKTPIGGEKPEA